MPNSNNRNNRYQKNTSKTRTNNTRTNTKRPSNKITAKAHKKKKMNPKFKMFLKILLVIFLLLCVVGAGIVAAMFFGLFGDQFEITKEELIVGDSNTIVLDRDGNEIANLSSDEKRKKISLSEMSPYLPKAYVAIEDKRFYSHNGVDIKRTAGAILGAVTGNSSYGGSSITQQLVKNITKDKARSGVAGVVRKMKEWSKAVQVERMISKDQILELYLNIIFVGGNELHGVELASQYYFNKSAKDLDLAECAFLAGINNSPNAYSPYDTSLDQEKTANLRKERTLTVLKEMKSQGMIENEDEYNAAVAKVEAGLTFEKGYSGASNYSYHTDATIKQVIEQVMEEKNISRDLAENYVYSSGLTIYSTEDSKVQARVEEELAKTKYQISGKEKNPDGTLKNDHTQAGIVIIDNETSQVVAVGGNLGEQKTVGLLNRGTQAVRQTGSSMKPLADIVPGLQEKVITAATIYDDSTTDFGGGYKPGDYNDPKGLINIRSCIRTSQNIPMVKVMMELTPKKSIEYLKKMGITTLDDEKDNNPSLSIGGLSKGITPLEMAGAYASIANDGVYTTPILYTKVVDSNGNVVLEPKQEKTKVISEQNAYLTRSIVKEPTQSGGTATYCAIPGMETCAKTGSTDEYKDRWLCGMTPYYTAACWWGYDSPEPLKVGKTAYSVDGRNPAGQIWSSIMKDIHKGLTNKNFNTPSTGIVTKTVCKDTGCIATTTCTNTYSEIFTADNIPETCQGHGVQRICTESGKVANEYCPADKVKTVSYGGVIPKEQLKLWNTLKQSKIASEKIDEVCTIHTKPVEKPAETPVAPATNTTNNNKNNVVENKTNTTTGPNNTTEKPNKNNTVVDETTE